MMTSYTSPRAHRSNDGGLRAYLVALGGGDEYDDDLSEAWSVPPVYVLRFAYDDPPEPSDWEGEDDDDDWEGEDDA